ncbi:MAG: hypothetical protein M3174_00690 [Actinomycetota bacterium]|nr:hypothetical protein [Actinomycetota bacterium]
MKKPRRRLLTIAGSTAIVLAGSIVFAAWVVPGSGSGYAKAKQAQALTTDDLGATSTDQLYPGATGDVKVKVNNPNPFPVTLTRVAADGPVSSDNPNCTDVGDDSSKQTGVSFAAQTLNADNVVPANGSLTLTLDNAVAMSNQSVNACQGAVFSVPVTFTASS